MYTGPLRLLRALTVSASCVALTLTAHLVGAGSGEAEVSVAAVLGLLMITVLLTLVLTALSGQRWTLGSPRGPSGPSAVPPLAHR